jgi:hypothetical protein
MDEGDSAIDTAVSLSQPLGQAILPAGAASAPARDEVGVRTVIGVPGVAQTGRGSQGNMPAQPPRVPPAAPPAAPPAFQGPGAPPAYPTHEPSISESDPLKTPPPTLDRASGLLSENMPLPSPPRSEIMPAAVPELDEMGGQTERGSEFDEAVVHTELHTRPRQGRGLLVLGALVVVALLGGGYVVYQRFLAGPPATVHATEPAATGTDAGSGPDRAATAVAGRDATAPNPAASNAGPPGPGTPNAGTPAQPDEPSTTRPAQRPATGGTLEMQEEPADKLAIRSQPERAKVYLDGSLQGTTPLALDATADQHTLAVILPGHRLFTAEIKGHGSVDITLEEVAPPGGEGGIKIRCRNKNRYYVFLDGKDSGQLCPTERIGVDVGEHVIEIYDPETETRQEFRINVEQTRRSTRLRVD